MADTKTRRKPATKKGPAAKETQPAKQPATQKEQPAVTVKAIAKRVGRTERSTRVAIRRILGDGKAVVGKGGRYGWKSWSHPQVKKIMSGLKSES